MEVAKELLKKYRHHEKDTGSTAVQIISLSGEIQKIIEHGNRNRKVNFNVKRKKERWKDIPARRTMLKKLAKRKKFFQYLEKNNPQAAEELRVELKKLK